MEYDIVKKQDESGDIIDIYNKVSQLDLQDAKLNIDTQKNTAVISGKKGDKQITSTVKQCRYGAVQINTVFEADLDRDARILQARELKKQGFKQQEIARALNISQATVSKYLKK